MIIKKVEIDNFKSIDHISIDFDKVGGSYTKTFVGVNESGKSNILEALSFFSVPDKEVSYDDYCNQKFEDREYCDLFFHLEFEEDITFSEIINDVVAPDADFKFKIKGLIKNVYLGKERESFNYCYVYDIELLSSKDLYLINTESTSSESSKTTKGHIITDIPETNAVFLTKDVFIETFRDNIENYIFSNEPNVSFWEPSPEYLLSDVNLNSYKKDINSNKPLKNIFKLSGYNDEKSIVDSINKITNSRNRSRLSSKLNDSLNNYISSIWKNNIDLLIEISDAGTFSLLIKDKGKENEHDRFKISDRSQGAKQFLSLILSLSIETSNKERKNELILIDEPEVHLHPSSIRDLSKELLKIGENNYVIYATHSPFMIDKRHKERHYIVKKNHKAITEIKKIREDDNIIDDEVLNEAFGINVYRDLLNPHSVLVEGASDKIIIKKALSLLGHSNIGITNGHGTNIDSIASKMNHDGISLLVVTDDDKDGRKYKNNILNIGGIYNTNNVFTIRDLEGSIIDQGTIEDALGVKYVESQFKKYYEFTFNEKISDITLSQDRPLISQIQIILKEKKKYSNWNMDSFKKYLSEEFNPSNASLKTQFKTLHDLAEKIINKLNINLV